MKHTKLKNLVIISFFLLVFMNDFVSGDDTAKFVNDFTLDKHVYDYANLLENDIEKELSNYKDKLIYGKSAQPFELYSNQWVPLIAGTDMVNRIYYASNWDQKVGGGAILHLNLGSNFDSVADYKNIVNMVANSGVIYFAFNTVISVCKYNHSFYGDICPICGGEVTDRYKRIVGYLVPLSSYNDVRRKKEFPSIQFYDKSKLINIDQKSKKNLNIIQDEILQPNLKLQPNFLVI
jgi:hypothetical protein